MSGNFQFRSSRLIPLWLLALGAVLQAQNIYHVESERTITVNAPGATDAYSLDSSCADAKAGDGVVSITGRIAGVTHVVVVLPSGALTWEIDVGKHPLRSSSELEELPSGDASGYYQSLYNTGPREVQTEVDLSRREDDLSIHAHLAGTDLLGEDSGAAARTELSSASYQIVTPAWSMTLLDQTLDESPLATTGSVVRGIHFSDDGWFLHAGFTSVTLFEGVFLPIQSESMIEGGYKYSLGENSSLTGSYYHFGVPSSAFMGRRGSTGRLTYQYKPSQHLKLNLDLGLSRGVGGAAKLDYSNARDALRATIQYAPPAFASLSATNLRGLRSDFRWTRRLSPRFDNNLTFYSNDTVLPSLHQSTATGGEQLQYRLTKRWSVFGGANGSIFQVLSPAAPAVLNLTTPLGVRFHRGAFSAEGQYEFTRVSEQDTGGRQFRGAVRGARGPVTVSLFAQQQTQTPSLSFVLSHATGLEQMLDQLGIQATTIQQVDQLLSDTAYLFAAGYITGASINLVPVRDQVGATVNWNHMGRRRSQLSYNFLYNDDHGLTLSTLTTSQSLTFTQRLGAEDIGLSYSFLDTQTPGMAPIRQQVLAVSWRHRVNSVPALVIPERHGVISGVVFRDDEAKGALEAAMPRIAGAEITLDGTRRTVSAADGSYRFSNVPEGRHKLAVSYQSARPTFFSTPSQTEVRQNAAINFGIAYSTAGVMGRVANDAGQGLVDVKLIIRGQGREWNAVTDGAGAFFVRQVPEGEYQVEVLEDSVPPGHLTADLSPQAVTVTASMPGSAVFMVRALRSIAGRVLQLDPASGQSVPVAGQLITLKGTDYTSVTDAMGRYLFRDLAAGAYTVALTAGSEETARAVTLPAAPATLVDIDLRLGPGTGAP